MVGEGGHVRDAWRLTAEQGEVEERSPAFGLVRPQVEPDTAVVEAFGDAEIEAGDIENRIDDRLGSTP